CEARRFFLEEILMTATRYESDSSKNSERTIMYETVAAWAPRALSVLRIYTGLLLLEHGTAKILGFPAVSSFANVQLGSLTGASGLIELIGGVVFTVGLFTRPVAFILSGFTAAAYFMAHAGKGFYPLLNDGELASFSSISPFSCFY